MAPVATIEAPKIITPKTPPAASKQEPLSRAVLMVALDEEYKGHLCVLPLQDGDNSQPLQTTLMLDGSVSNKKIREVLRDLRWRVQRGNPCYVVIPSEDVLLLIEEFPSTDMNEIRVMAEGLVQGMIELDQSEHVLLIHDLYRDAASTVCALAVVPRKRLQKIFECVQKLGITNPRFVLDVVGLWQISGEVLTDGFWGRVVKDDASALVIVKALKIVNGVIRTVRQRFYYRESIDDHWVDTLAHQLFPDEFEHEHDPGITWFVSHRSLESPAHLIDFCRLAANGKIINFEPQPGFWKEHLKLQAQKRQIRAGLTFIGICYALFILYMTAMAVWHWHEQTRLNTYFAQNDQAYREAVQTSDELKRAQDSLKSSETSLEVLRQINDVRPDELTLKAFDHNFHEKLVIQGLAGENQRATVRDFVLALRNNPLFSRAEDPDFHAEENGLGWTVKILLRDPTTP
jgi:hypothetical protein